VTPLDRRAFLTSTAGATGAVALGVAASGPAAAAGDRVFRHGVASGDPWPHSVVLWTRVTPTPADTPGSGRGTEVTVRWQVARDAAFTRVVRTGTVTTGPARDHTVKLVAGGLRPATTYHYRFLLDGARSPVGRTRTAPPVRALPRRLRLGVVSCANWQAGYFSAYRHLAALGAHGDLDAVLHLGDYLYEYAPGGYGYGPSNTDVRPHAPRHETVTLADYRRRHAQYKTDPDLQALHATAPWVVTWDDHESANDAHRRGAENHTPATEGGWRARRAAAYRAYDEWMPVRLGASAALGDGHRIYRRLRFGRLADLSMLDLRTYRSKQAAHQMDRVDDPRRTVTGDAQMRWLKDGLRESPAQWKLVANPVMVAPVVFPPLPRDVSQPLADVTGLLPPDGVPYNLDQWDGYTADRRELLGHLADHGIGGAVFLTGDIHSAWANDLPADAGTYPASPSLATEFVCTSVTSNNLDDMTGSPPRTTSLAVEAAIQANNRHVRYLDFDSHGYSVLDVTPARVQMDYYVVGDRRDRDAGSSWSASWATAADSNTVHPEPAPSRGRG
jgi:alkaline phosphatase D